MSMKLLFAAALAVLFAQPAHAAPIGIASAVQRSQRAFFGSIRSSPVINATRLSPLIRQTRS